MLAVGILSIGIIIGLLLAGLLLAIDLSFKTKYPQGIISKIEKITKVKGEILSPPSRIIQEFKDNLKQYDPPQE